MWSVFVNRKGKNGRSIRKDIFVSIYTFICADTIKTEQEYVAEQMRVCSVRPMRISAGGGAVVVVIYRATGGQA